MNEPLLKGKAALVTGASGGIGRALAEGLAQAGARVAVHAYDDLAGGRDTVARISERGGDAALVEADLRDTDAIARMVDEVYGRWGRIDTLVNNAGITGWNAALDVTPALWDQVIDTNLKGTFFCTTATARHMKADGGGSIINISSVVGLTVMRNLSVYATSKAGLAHMTRQLAVELAAYGIRINAIAPGPTLVPRNLQDDPDYAANWAGVTPLGQVATPEDMVGAVVFFASEASRMITGQVLAVDGGLTLVGQAPRASLDRALDRNRR